MKLALIGDIHLSSRSPRHAHALEVLDWTIADARAADVTHFVLLGDLCEGAPTPEEYGALLHRIHTMRQDGAQVGVCLGNHEHPNTIEWFERVLGIRCASTDFALWHEDALVLLTPYPRRGRAPFDDLPGDGTIQGSFHAVAERIRSEIKVVTQINPDRPLIVLGHFTISGMATRDTDFETHNATEPIIPQDVFATTALTAVGHIHRAQNVAPNIIGVGSLIRHSFAEASDEKSYVVVTVNGHNVTWERRPVPAREMIVMDVELALGGEIVIDDALVASAAGREVKVTARIHEEMLRAYDPDVFAPLRAAAALFQLDKDIVRSQRVRAPGLQRPKPIVHEDGSVDPEPPPLDLMDYVRAWLNATDQPLPPERMERLTAKVATLTI